MAWTEHGRTVRQYCLRKADGTTLKVFDLGDEVQAVTPSGYVKVVPGWTVDEAKAYLEGL
jgi:hypothetical protein